MFCTNCGNDVPMGSVACPVCGAPAPVDMNAQQAAPMGMDMGMQQPYQAAPAYAPVPQSNKKGLFIGIAVAVVLIVAIIVVLKIFVFGGGKYNGEYLYDDMASFGIKIELEIDGDEFTMTSLVSYDLETWEEQETVTGEVEVDDEEVILIQDGEELVLEVDDGDLVMEESGFEMRFEKQ